MTNLNRLCAYVLVAVIVPAYVSTVAFAADSSHKTSSPKSFNDAFAEFIGTNKNGDECRKAIRMLLKNPTTLRISEPFGEFVRHRSSGRIDTVDIENAPLLDYGVEWVQKGNVKKRNIRCYLTLNKVTDVAFLD